MEGDVVGFCDTKHKTCTTTKDDNNAKNVYHHENERT
jgi:hypothetical protein